MKFVFSSLVLSGMLGGVALFQPPGGEPRQGRGPRQGGVGETIARVMSLDKNEDGKLTEDEYGESRLKAMIVRADSDDDKTVTKEEITELVQKEMAAQGRGFEGGPGGRGGPGPGPGPGPGGPGPGGPGPGGPGPGGPGPGGFGQGGPGPGPDGFGPGGRGMGPMMRPGMIMPEFMQQQLTLSAEQKDQIAKLQETVDAEMAKILTPEQLEQFKQPMMGRRGGPGFEGGPGGPGFGGGYGFGGGRGGEGDRRQGPRGESRRPAGENDGASSAPDIQ